MLSRYVVDSKKGKDSYQKKDSNNSSFQNTNFNSVFKSLISDNKNPNLNIKGLNSSTTV